MSNTMHKISISILRTLTIFCIATLPNFKPLRFTRCRLTLLIFWATLADFQSIGHAAEPAPISTTQIEAKPELLSDCSLISIKGVEFKLKIESFSTVIMSDSDKPEIIKCYRIPEAPQLIAIEWNRGAVGTYTFISKYQLLIINPSKTYLPIIYTASLGEQMEASADPSPNTFETQKYSFTQNTKGLWIIWADTNKKIRILTSTSTKP